MKVYVFQSWDDGALSVFTSKDELKKFLRAYMDFYQKEGYPVDVDEEITITETELSPSFNPPDYNSHSKELNPYAFI